MVRHICRRCTLISDAASGQFDLAVTSVRLGRDHEFECQVLPGPEDRVKVPLRASVYVEIQGEIVRFR